MIHNATLLRIDRGGGGADASGEIAFTEGAAISVRCFVGGIASKLHFTLGSTIKDAQRLCHIEKAALAAAGEEPPEEGNRLTVSMDRGEEQTGEAILVDERVMNNLDHWAAFLKKVS